MRMLGFFLALLISVEASAQQRIIALSPALTELVYKLNLNKFLVGVSDFSDFPDAAKLLPSVGPYTSPNMEKILALRPDLILLPLEGPEDIKSRFDQLHIKYSVIKMRTLEEIGDAAKDVGQLLGNLKAGQDFQTQWNENLKKIFLGTPKQNSKIFIEVQRNPLIAAGKGTFLDEIVNKCGGENIVKEKGYPKLSLEFVAIRDLNFVFLADFFPKDKDRDLTVAWWKSQSYPPKHIVPLDPATTARPGPRLLEGVRQICSLLKTE